MINKKTEMFENQITRLKAYYLEEIRERDEKLTVKCSRFNYYNYLLIFYIISESSFKFQYYE